MFFKNDVKMNKTGNFHGSFDPNVYMSYVQIVGKGNVTQSLQQYMQTVIATHHQNVEGVNLKILQLEIEDIQKRITKQKAELDSKLVLKGKIEEKAKDAEKQRLEAERKKIEETSKCMSCGNVLGDRKFHELKRGKLCHACYMSMSPKDMARFLGGKDE